MMFLADGEVTVSQVDIPVLVVGIRSDQLYPPAEQKELTGLLPNANYAELDSPYGHDAFLIEFKTMNNVFADFLSNIEKQNLNLQHK